MDAEVVDRIATTLRAFGRQHVNIGFQGVYLANDLIEETRNNAFCIRDPKHLAIGSAGGCGDPLVVDVSQNGFPVLSINHDMVDDELLGSEPDPVADALDQFLLTLSKLQEHLSTLNAAISYEDSPMSTSEIDAFVAEHCRNNPRSGDGFFWRLLLERDTQES